MLIAAIFKETQRKLNPGEADLNEQQEASQDVQAADTGNPVEDGINQNANTNTVEGVLQLYQNEFVSDGNRELVQKVIENDVLIS